MADAFFTTKTFKFLRELDQNNDRDWFNANKQRYEDEVREPALAFIRAMDPWLKKKFPAFIASDKKVGGSMMRIHRDVRFSKDKRPYKTNVGIQFRHGAGKNVHAPGLYVHIADDECFLGAGMYMPDSDALAAIRAHIVENPKKYKKIVEGKAFTGVYRLGGVSLKRPPRGFDKEHPLIDELKRKSFIGVCDLKAKDVTSAGFLKDVQARFESARPFCAFLCEATGVDF